MNRGRAARKDYHKILKHMPTDKLQPTQPRYQDDHIPHISRTINLHNDKSLSPHYHRTEVFKEHVHRSKILGDIDRRLACYQKDSTLDRRFKTLQRSIDLHDRRRDSSFDRLLKKDLKPLRDSKKEARSPYTQKIMRQSLNIVPGKERNQFPLHNSNRLLREGVQVSFSHRGKFSSKSSLKGVEASSKSFKYSEEEYLSKGRLAQQEGRLPQAIEHFS